MDWNLEYIITQPKIQNHSYMYKRLFITYLHSTSIQKYYFYYNYNYRNWSLICIEKKQLFLPGLPEISFCLDGICKIKFDGTIVFLCVADITTTLHIDFCLKLFRNHDIFKVIMELILSIRSL